MSVGIMQYVAMPLSPILYNNSSNFTLFYTYNM